MTTITVVSRFEGFHKWESAPEEVAFLRNLHRHVFGVSVSFKVTHSDRQLEFFTVQRTLNLCIKELTRQLASDPRMSCEMMAEYLFYRLLNGYYLRAMQITVSEDGENSGSFIPDNEETIEYGR